MNGGMYLACIVLLLVGNQPIQSAKVLMVPFHHRSHINIFRNLGKALADDGHDVFVLTSSKFVKLLEGHNIIPISFPLTKDADINEPLEQGMKDDPTGKSVLESAYKEIWTEPKQFCDNILGNITMMDAIKEEQFNLAIMDGGLGFACTYTIPYKHNIPYITFHGMNTASWAAGITGMPSIEPDVLMEASNKMDFWERLSNLHYWFAAMEDPFMASFDKHFLQTYVAEKTYKTFYNIIRDSEMFLLNYEVLCLDYPRVSAPNYQYLGPSTVKPASPLSKNLELFVKGADHGVVVMSVGSFSAWKYVWLILRDKMFPAFGKLKQRVVVQYNLDEPPQHIPENVRIMKWLPQLDLLAQPNTKLFVTHGGNNGQNEAVYHGVPMLVIPIMVDQPYAGVRAVAKGYGKYVKDKEAITSSELVTMMEDIIYNESYSKNIERCSKIMKSVPTAQERFVFWVNHILEFGGRHLRPPSMDMPLYEVLMLDIVAYYVVIGLVSIHVSLGLTCLLCRFVFKRGKAKGKKD